MKVNKNKWHYKLYCWLHTVYDMGPDWAATSLGRRIRRKDGYRASLYQPSSLCKYFWFIVFSTFFVAVFGLFFGTLFGFAMLVALFGYYAFYVPFCWTKDKIAAWRKTRREKKPNYVPKIEAPKEPSLVASFVKAKKNKVCPLITIVDETGAPVEIKKDRWA